MAYLTNQLITRAFFLSQVLARDLQTISGSQMEDGLYLLNALLDSKFSDLQLIPYYSEYQLTTEQGLEKYFIPNLAEADTTTFNMGDVRFSMQARTRKEYFGTPRVDNIQSLMNSYRYERCLKGSNLYFYFVPNQEYLVKIWGKFALTDVTLYQDISLVYDLFYIEYLRFALAQYICCEYGQTFPEECQKKFKEIVKKLKSVSPADLSINKRSFFNANYSIDWQTANLTTGYVPVS